MKLEIKPLDVDFSVLSDWQRDYPEAHFQAWISSNDIPESMVYCKSAYDSMIFFRDNISRMFDKELSKIEVISTHTSKSIKLPVIHATFKNGLQLIIRDNFHDIKVSVISPDPLGFPKNLFCNNDDIASVYCEGFESNWVFPDYSETNNKEFTVEIYNEYLTYTFFFLLREQL